MTTTEQRFPPDEQGSSDISGSDSPSRDKVVQEQAEERSSPSGHVVYHAILKEADEELSRASSGLFWSGLAAGLAMGFSLIAQGVFRHYLPDATWTPLVAKLGYSAGFLIVILGRQQLFTENTLTPILPLLKRRDRQTLLHVMRLWGVVLLANMLGALLIAFVLARTNAMDIEVRAEFFEIGREQLTHSFGTTFLRAIFAGWLVALIVWMLPYAETARFWVILSVTWLIGVGHFAHVIAGSVDVFVLAWADHTTWWNAVSMFVIPTLLGNIVGGVTLVAGLNHAQVAAGHHEHD